MPSIGFRRGWATYEAIYLFAKFGALFIVAVVDPNNCLFRTMNSRHVSVIRQIVLLIGTVAFFAMQCFLAPFLDPVGNASEWMSRVNYVLTTIVSLLVALDVPGQDIINGPVLYMCVLLSPRLLSRATDPLSLESTLSPTDSPSVSHTSICETCLLTASQILL